MRHCAWAFAVGVAVALVAGPATGQTVKPLDLAQITPIAETDAVHAGTDVRVALEIRLPDGVHANSNTPRELALVPFTATVDAPTGVSTLSVLFPSPSDLRQRDEAEPLSVFQHTFRVGVQLRLASNVASGPLVVPVTVHYQACDETRCFVPAMVSAAWTLQIVPASIPIRVTRPDLLRGLIPTAARTAAVGQSKAPATSSLATPATAVADLTGRLDRFSVTATAGGYLRVGEFTTFLNNAERGVTASGPFEGRGTVAILLLVLLGGLALNLTPCVLPLIPINLAILGAGRRASSRRRGVLIGMAYGGAMAAVYGVLGATVVMTSSAFGAINASPWFNAGVAVVFAVLGLSMFDLFFIDASRLSGRLSPIGTRGSLGLAMTMGALAAVLAGACVAPVVIQVVLFSTDLYASGTHAAVALPFMLGLGMAAPWPVVGAGLAALPKPGAWMIRVKQALGATILVLAAYYAHTAYGMFAARISGHAVPPNAATLAGWHTSLAEALDVARREQKPVFVDLWATWCKNCLAMDETTLVDPSVSSGLAGYVKVKFQAEDPDDPRVRAVMSRFGVVGLPAYVVLRTSDSHPTMPSAAALTPATPDFSLPALNGEALTLQSLRGRIVVLNFWATWCPPCRTEIPELMAVRAMFDPDDVALVGIATDDGGRAVVAPYVEQERFALGPTDAAMNYPVLLGTPEVADAYRVDGLPMTVVLDRSGQVVRRFDQPVQAGDLAPEIRRLISTSVRGVR